ncbi:MAG: hypothetical protein Q8Q49_03645 [bacterium]|nr:hypothetical protein [bacterium]
MSAEHASRPLPSPDKVASRLSPHIVIPSSIIYGSSEPSFFPGELPLSSSSPALESEPISYPEWWPTEYVMPGSTAKHEAQHVTMAILKHGVLVEEVSREPGPGYRGITICAGNLQHKPHALQLIAAAGAVDPVGMKAEGFGHHLLHGSDLHVAHSLEEKTGKTAKQAVEEAATFLGTVPERAREIIASVIESLGTVRGKAKISELVTKALEIAKRETSIVFVPQTSRAFEREDIHDREYASSVIRDDKTWIITPDDGPTRVVIVTIDDENNPLNPDKNGKDFLCDTCHGQNAHKAECSKKDATNAEEMKGNNSPAETAPGSKPHIIFDAKKHLRRFSLN